MVRVIKQTVRFTLDIAMTIILLCSYAYRITGDTAHEWIGIVIFLFVTIHIIINRNWFKLIFNGAYSQRRIIMTVVNLLLAIDFSILFITGLSHSRTVLSFLNLQGSIILRQIHTTATYRGLPLIGVHIGLHWGMFTRFISKNRFIIYIMCILALLFAAFGIWSSFDRDMFSKLFLGFSFDYWPEERPAILFFLIMLLIIAVYIFITYYLLKILKLQRKK
jgi:hypothetical protein